MAVPQGYVDALIGGTEFYRWNANAPLGTPTFVTYSFMNAVPAYDPEYRGGFAPLTEAQKVNARAAFATWEAVSGLTFLEVPSQVGGNIAVGMYNFTGTQWEGFGGIGYFPVIDDDYNDPFGGTIYLNSAKITGDLNPGGGGFYTLVHEIGHAIGLKHPFEGTPTLPTVVDSQSNTVMSYTGPNNASAPQEYDVGAAWYLYGALDKPHLWDAANLTLTIYGNASIENLLGIEFNDIISAGGGNDFVRGQQGNDWLFGGDGSDTVQGDAGNDVLYGDTSTSESGTDYLDGGAGNDILIGGNLADVVLGDLGDDWIFGGNGADGANGGPGNDVLYGDLFSGEVGNDVFEGQGGNDIVIGGEGDDVVYGGFASGAFDGGHDWLYGSNGSDTLFAGAGDDVLFGDLFIGEAGNDTLYGEAGNDLIMGGPGDDVIAGGHGTDIMYGEGGRDWFTWASTGEAYQDRVLDFAAGSGGDVIYLAGAGFAGMSFDSFMSNYVRGVNESTVIDFDGFGSTYQIELYFIPKAALTSDNFVL